MKPARRPSIEQGVDGQSPFLRVKKSADPKKAHQQKYEALKVRAPPDEKSRDWREDAKCAEENDSFLVVDRFHSPALNVSRLFSPIGVSLPYGCSARASPKPSLPDSPQCRAR
jgi:hypothetical protein